MLIDEIPFTAFPDSSLVRSVGVAVLITDQALCSSLKRTIAFG